MTDTQDQARELPPNAIEAEEAVLGSIMLNPLALYQVPFLKSDDFFIVRNQWVWEAIQRLHERNEEIDNVTVVEEIRAKGQLQEIGGAAYITYLINHTPSSIYTDTYGRIVERAAIRRRGLAAASAIATAMYEESGNIDDTIAAAQDAFFAWMATRNNGRAASAAEIAEEVYADAEAAYLAYQRNETMGLPTGFEDLDELLGGFHKGDFYVLAGRPGMGKTSLILSIIRRLVKAGIPVGVFSLEMNRKQAIQRLISMDTGISTHTIRNGRFTERQWELFVEADTRLAGVPLFVDDTASIDIGTLRTQAKAWYLEHGIRMVFVDYLQLAGGDRVRENRTQEVGSISRGLKACARELDIPVFSAAQLSRAPENRADKRPGLADLRESGDIENDADAVMFVYRDEYYNLNTEQKNIGEVIIGKHRNGPTGAVELYWKPKLTQFTDIGARNEVDTRAASPNAADNG